MSGQRQVFLGSLDEGARTESWSFHPSSRPRGRKWPKAGAVQVQTTVCCDSTSAARGRASSQAPQRAMGTAPNFFSLSPKEGGHQELTQASPLHNSPSVVAGQVAFPPHAQSLPHSKKAALALPIHSLSLSFLPYNSPTQNRLYTQHASARLCGEYCPILSIMHHTTTIKYIVFTFWCCACLAAKF